MILFAILACVHTIIIFPESRCCDTKRDCPNDKTFDKWSKSEDYFCLFKAIQNILNIYETIFKDNESIISYTSGRLWCSPVDNYRVDAGLFLEFNNDNTLSAIEFTDKIGVIRKCKDCHYGDHYPHSILTPWGIVHLYGTLFGDVKDATKLFLTRVKISPIPFKESIFEIIEVDGKKLPKAKYNYSATEPDTSWHKLDELYKRRVDKTHVTESECWDNQLKVIRADSHKYFN